MTEEEVFQAFMIRWVSRPIDIYSVLTRPSHRVIGSIGSVFVAKTGESGWHGSPGSGDRQIARHNLERNSRWGIGIGTYAHFKVLGTSLQNFACFWNPCPNR